MSLRKTNSLTFRLTLLFSLASTIILLALGFLIRQSVDKHFEELDASLLANLIQPVRLAVAGDAPSIDSPQLAKQIERATVDGAIVLVQRLDAQGAPQTIAGDASAFPDALLQSAWQREQHPMTWPARGMTYRGMAERMKVGDDNRQEVLIAVATDISHHEHFMATFQITLWSFVGFAALLMGLLGWLAARHGLSPLKRIQQDASDISANRLDQRLSAEQLPAELADLGHALNGMLSRLQESFRRLSDFSADIAHELRTPVSNLMTQTQVALAKARSADEYRDVLASNAEELDRMARMISDMLFLAKADHGLIIPGETPISLAQEFQELFSFYEAWAAEKNIAFSLDGDGQLFGDKPMLRRAFSNLLSNAIQHTPDQGAVNVRIHPDKGGKACDLWFENSATIAAEDLPRLFDRFFRANTAGRDDSEGAGLGLAITKSIIQLHGGDIRAYSDHGLTTFHVRLPVHVKH